jgi:divinyl protochlorophyllide a 8-vinyl-reductase
MPHEAHHGRVGPNAILQVASVLQDTQGLPGLRLIFERAGLLTYVERPPTAMVEQGEASRLFDALRLQLGHPNSDRILAEAGRRTAQYIIANRIPSAARRLISALPVGLGSRLLLIAIHKHAWTFAGSGKVRKGLRRRLWLSIEANPLATPGCPWHKAVLQELFAALVSPYVRVLHDECCAEGESACMFRIEVR